MSLRKIVIVAVLLAWAIKVPGLVLREWREHRRRRVGADEPLNTEPRGPKVIHKLANREPGAPKRPRTWREILTGRPDWDAVLRWNGYGVTLEGEIDHEDVRVVRPLSKRTAPKPRRRKRTWRERITGNIDWRKELQWLGYDPDQGPAP